TADGALGTATTILQRMRDLAVQASNTGSSDPSAQAAAQTEFDQLNNELTRISNTTSFGNTKLLDGTYGGFADKKLSLVGTNGAALTAGDTAATDTVKVTVNRNGNDSIKEFALTNTGARAYTADAAGATALAVNLQKDFDAAGLSDLTISVDNALVVTITSKTSASATTDKVTVEAGATNVAASTLDIFGAASQVSAAITETTANRKTFQVGANGTANDTITVSIDDMDATKLGTNGLSLVGNAADGAANAANTLKKVEAALSTVSAARATLGAVQNRFEHTINNLNVSIENITASQSAIRDTDMAAEMTKFTRNQILTQAGTSMLAQANSAAQNVLSLLRG
ncbi:flagellin, partial [Kineococcus xinjiangensis]